eukprot:6196153-Pleurochrysis_carterae.AAC.3
MSRQNIYEIQSRMLPCNRKTGKVRGFCGRGCPRHGERQRWNAARQGNVGTKLECARVQENVVEAF